MRGQYLRDILLVSRRDKILQCLVTSLLVISPRISFVGHMERRDSCLGKRVLLQR